MKSFSAYCLAVAVGLGAVSAQANPVINEAETPTFLYTMSAQSGTYDDDTLTLSGVPVVVYFSDRPYRLSGTVSVEAFDQIWGQGTDSFSADPPNATLSILNQDGADNVVVELSDPNLNVTDMSISFGVSVLNGALPGAFGVSTLFIDGFNFGPNPGD